MTQPMDDLMQMAEEAGFEIDCCSLEWVARIERFAQLVAKKAVEAEREACAILAATPLGTIAKEIRARSKA